MTVHSDSKQQNQQKEDLDLREVEVKQWEQELELREQEVEQREEAVIDRNKRQYDRWLQFAEWETDLRQTHYAVQHGHARLSKWLKEADADWTDRLTTVRRMEHEVRCEKLRLKAQEEKENEKGKGKVNEDEEEKENEDEKHKGTEEEKELTHCCFGSELLPWNYGRRACGDPKDESSSPLIETLLTPEQSTSIPIPSGTPTPITADATGTTTRTSKPKSKGSKMRVLGGIWRVLRMVCKEMLFEFMASRVSADLVRRDAMAANATGGDDEAEDVSI